MIDLNNEIIIYQTEDGQTSVDVKINNETVWLNRQQLSILFDRDIKTIGKHINNALKEELEGDPSVVANFATTASDGKTYQVDYYNFLPFLFILSSLTVCKGDLMIIFKYNSNRCAEKRDSVHG